MLNKFEIEFDQFKPSYQFLARKEKHALLYQWNDAMRNPFFKLKNMACRCSGMYGLVSRKELDAAGFTEEKLAALQAMIAEYTKSENHPSLQLASALMKAKSAYYAVELLAVPAAAAVHSRTDGDLPVQRYGIALSGAVQESRHSDLS